MDPFQSFESLDEEETGAIAGSSRGPSVGKPLSSEESILRSSNPSRRMSGEESQSPEISSHFDDMALCEVSQLCPSAIAFTSILLNNEIESNGEVSFSLG